MQRTFRSVDALGHFYDVDMLFSDIGIMAIAHILVGLDLREGLIDTMILNQGTILLRRLSSM